PGDRGRGVRLRPELLHLRQPCGRTGFLGTNGLQPPEPGHRPHGHPGTRTRERVVSPDVTSLPDQPDQPAEPPRPRLSAGADAAELPLALGAPCPLEPIRLSGGPLYSRGVETVVLWCALPGANAHCAQFAAQARERGAALALTDAAVRPRCARAGLPALGVADPRRDS